MKGATHDMTIDAFSGHVEHAGHKFFARAVRNGYQGGRRHLVVVIHYPEPNKPEREELDYRGDIKFTAGLLRRAVAEFWETRKLRARNTNKNAVAAGTATALSQQEAG